MAATKGLPPVGKDEIAVTLIGTGSVVPNTTRYGNSTLVQAGGVTLLIDAGRGCAVRLTQAGMPMGHIDAFFLTHFHSDHVIGLPDLWMTGYLHPDFGLRTGMMEVNGPIGTTRLCNSLRDAFSDDIRIREADEHIDDEATRIKANEFSTDGVIFERNGVKVTAFEVNHGPLIKPACGYRVDYAGKSVLVSGDTKFDENLIKHGAGCDLIVHEVGVASEKLSPGDQLIMNHHTSPEEAGIVFARTKPRLAVFSHIVDLLDDQRDGWAVHEILRRTKKNWAGKVMVGDDLTRIVISETAVKVQKFNEAKGTYAG
jgi:ribonuclease Z